MKIKEISWICEEIQEAEVIVTDGKYELLCFSHPFKLDLDSEVKELSTLDTFNIVRSFENFYRIEKLHGYFAYAITGQLINKTEGIVKVGDIYIDIGNDIPKDILEKEFISFTCGRIDIV